MSEYINNQGYRVGQLSSMRKELVRGEATSTLKEKYRDMLKQDDSS